MKLATYRDGSRDGVLVVVSRDLREAHYATHAADRLQQALDDWNYIGPQLQDVYDALNAGRAREAFPFEPARCMAPLPRAAQWVEGCAFPRQEARVRMALPAGAIPSDAAPLLFQGASDDFRGACAPVRCPAEAGADFGAGLAAITADLPMGCSAERALQGIRLLALTNSICLRTIEEWELARGMGVLLARVATVFSPVALTPDELGEGWREGRVHGTLQVDWNGRRVGMCDVGSDMRWGLHELLAHVCRTRTLHAGSVMGSGAASNRDNRKGYACVADRRMSEALEQGEAMTAWPVPGDSVRIEMKGRDGRSLFGAIDQVLAGPEGQGEADADEDSAAS
ncbi:fumarylacetoacetate hydrolase family protein [Brachymonas sp.]|uniref:fumarylacetoacetate hydrolase family protein n=1 Tax=Brachymonas sp. TaxID=1936292 RepID=UPI0035AF5AFB